MKNTFCLCLLLLLSFDSISYSQIAANLSIDKKVKYEFERYDGAKTTKMRPGDNVQISMKTADTTIVYFGDLLRATNSDITINLDFIEKYIDAENSHYKETKLIWNPMQYSVSYSRIDFIAKTTNRSQIGPLVGAGAFTVAVLAPLACIDKNAESGFNAKRYVSLIKYTAVAAGVGIITSIALADYQRFILKPKLISVKKN